MKLKIQEAARLTGVSAKTLRYYDQIGLLRPSELSPAGYRLYGQAELSRLREILLLRELDFPLKDIAALLDIPERDKQAAFLRQKELLKRKRRRLDGVIALVDTLLKGETAMNFEPFCSKEYEQAKAQYAQEVKERWGSTEAYKESQRREQARTEQQNEAALREMNALLDRFGALADASPEDPRVQALVGEWQACISKWYYPCTNEILAGLGQMYLGDSRFRENIDSHGPGAARLMSNAIEIYCK